MIMNQWKVHEFEVWKFRKCQAVRYYYDDYCWFNFSIREPSSVACTAIPFASSWKTHGLYIPRLHQFFKTFLSWWGLLCSLFYKVKTTRQSAIILVLEEKYHRVLFIILYYRNIVRLGKPKNIKKIKMRFRFLFFFGAKITPFGGWRHQRSQAHDNNKACKFYSGINHSFFFSRIWLIFREFELKFWCALCYHSSLLSFLIASLLW